MVLPTDGVLTINGDEYQCSDISSDGLEVLSLLLDCQDQLKRHETKKSLLIAAREQLLRQLGPFLPPPKRLLGANQIHGEASTEIPTTSSEQPNQKPPPLPEDIPERIRAT